MENIQAETVSAPRAALQPGHKHYMHQEIFQQPQAIVATLAGRVSSDGREVVWSDHELNSAALSGCRYVLFLGSGTAYNAGLLGAALVKRLSGLPARAEPASEFRFGQAPLPRGTLAVAISQSGQTADTLAAVKAARDRGARFVMAVTNVAKSRVAAAADFVCATRAGTEVAVASTKAYMAQLVNMVLLAVGFGRAQGSLSGDQAQAVLNDLLALPDQIKKVLAAEKKAQTAGQALSRRRHAFYIGRQLDWITAYEGQLKLKETSYIHAEACAAGELRHGPLAVVDDEYTVVGIVTRPDLRQAMLRSLTEARGQGAQILLVAPAGSDDLHRCAHHTLTIPAINPILGPLLSVVPLQLLAYYAAVSLDRPVDQPRSLVKSLTDD